MKSLTATVVILLLFAHTGSAQDKKQAALDPTAADRDFAVQGEYSGVVGDDALKVGVQVVALGDGKFQSVGYIGGLPGDGWNGQADTKIPGGGQWQGDVVVLKPSSPDAQGRVEVKEGVMTLYNESNERLAEFSKVSRQSPTLGKKAPEDAVVLFDGTSADNFKGGRMSDDHLLMQGATSKQTFGSYNLHMEFLLSYMPHARGQGRANSGAYQQGRYEVQILDSFGLEGKDNECGGIYKVAAPRINMCLPPLTWQTYDVEFHEAKYDDAGNKIKNAWISVKHNGEVIHEKQELPHGTAGGPLKEGPEDGPLYLQDHGNPIRFRNIWVQPITE